MHMFMSCVNMSDVSAKHLAALAGLLLDCIIVPQAGKPCKLLQCQGTAFGFLERVACFIQPMAGSLHICAAWGLVGAVDQRLAHLHICCLVVMSRLTVMFRIVSKKRLFVTIPLLKRHAGYCGQTCAALLQPWQK